MQKNTFSLNVLEEVDEELISRMEKMNIDKKQARKFINTNQHNSITTTYYLLLKQKLMNGGKIMTAEMIAAQNSKPNKPGLKLIANREGTRPAVNSMVKSGNTSYGNSPRSKKEVKQGLELRNPAPPSGSSLLKYKLLRENFIQLPTLLPSPTPLDQESEIKEIDNYGTGLQYSISPMKKLSLIYHKPNRYKLDQPEKDDGEHFPNDQNALVEIETVNQAKQTQKSDKSQSVNKKSTAALSGSAVNSKMSNIYLNLKKYTSKTKTPGVSGRSKGETKSNSNSRGKVNLMKSLDFTLGKNSNRKISNPSFQSSSTEEQAVTRSFVVTNSKDSEIRRVRNPFSFDLITEIHPNDLVKSMILIGKTNNFICTPRVVFRL